MRDHPLVAEADQLQRREQRGMRVGADQHVHRRRAEQAVGIGIPAGLEQRTRCAPRQGRCRWRPSRRWQSRWRFRAAGRGCRAASARRFPRSPRRRGSACGSRHSGPRRETSQSAATPAGCEAPITQPKKRGPMIGISPRPRPAPTSSSSIGLGGPCRSRAAARQALAQRVIVGRAAAPARPPPPR